MNTSWFNSSPFVFTRKLEGVLERDTPPTTSRCPRAVNAIFIVQCVGVTAVPNYNSSRESIGPWPLWWLGSTSRRPPDGASSMRPIYLLGVHLRFLLLH